MSPTTTIGCDLGDKKSHICVLGFEGSVSVSKKIPTTRRSFERFFGDLEPSRVVLEVGAHSRWTSALLKKLGHRVVVANPRRVQLIFGGSRKSDRIDAETLARLGRADEKLLSPVTHRSEQAQNDLAVIKSRDALVSARTGLINRCRGVAKSAGHRLKKCDADCFHKLTVPDELTPALAPLLDAIGEITQRIRLMDKQIEETAACCYPEVAEMTAVDSVGALTALAFILTLDDRSRFPNPRQAGPFVGLVPKRAQSGDNDPQLGITKAGDAYLRRLLIGSANRILGPFGRDSDLRRFGLRLIERGGKNAKKRAVVAVARKLAVLLCKLWSSGEKYVPLGYRAA